MKINYLLAGVFSCLFLAASAYVSIDTDIPSEPKETPKETVMTESYIWTEILYVTEDGKKILVRYNGEEIFIPVEAKYQDACKKGNEAMLDGDKQPPTCVGVRIPPVNKDPNLGE